MLLVQSVNKRFKKEEKREETEKEREKQTDFQHYRIVLKKQFLRGSSLL